MCNHRITESLPMCNHRITESLHMCNHRITESLHMCKMVIIVFSGFFDKYGNEKLACVALVEVSPTKACILRYSVPVAIEL